MLGIQHHSMWLDEVNCWLIAKNSHSLSELFHLNRYGGNPMLWDVLLYILTRFTAHPFFIQLLNILLSFLAAFLFLKYSPFTVLQKICILFSYFFFFEYNIISRTYELTWLLLVAFCILLTHPKRNYAAITFILILLANTHLFSLLVSIPLFFITLYFIRKEKETKPKTILLLSCLFLVGLIVSIISIIPAHDTFILQSLNESYFSADRISKASSYFVKGLYPFPDFFTYHFWNTNFIVSYLKPLSIILTAIILLAPITIFYEKYLLLLFFYISNFSIVISLFMLKLFTGTRYMGYSFMILLVALWLATDERFKSTPKFIQPWSALLLKVNKIVAKPFLWSIIGTQLLVGVCTYYMALKIPFSEGANVAEIIYKWFPPNTTVMVVPANSGPAVSAYLKREVYYPELNSYGTFYQWNAHPVLSNKELGKRIITTLNSDTSHFNAIVISLAYDSIESLQHSLEFGFDTTMYYMYKKAIINNGIITGENYVIYSLESHNPTNSVNTSSK